MNPQDPGAAPPPNQGYPPPQYPGYPEQPEQPKLNNPLAVMQPGEQNICEIKRHPVGMMITYVMSGLLLVVLAAVVFGVAPAFVTSVPREQVLGVGSLLFFVVAMLVFGFVFIANKVYWGNRWVLTSDSITQMTQTSLFDKQSSQLSLGNLEDVTAEQNGLLPHMFNYGVLRVETAGDRSKFLFPFCPNPDFYAKQILSAREQFEQGRRGNDEQRLYRDQNAYQQPQPGPYGQPGPAGPAPAPYGQPQPGKNPQYGQPPQTNPMPPNYGGNDPDQGVNINTNNG